MQVVIRDSRESKYYVVKGQPNYSGGKKSAVTPTKGKQSSGNFITAPSNSNTRPASGNTKPAPT